MDGLSYLIFNEEEFPIGGTAAVVIRLFEFLSPDPNWLTFGTTFDYYELILLIISRSRNDDLVI